MLDSGGNRLDDCEVTDRLQKRTSKHLIKDNIGWVIWVSFCRAGILAILCHMFSNIARIANAVQCHN